MKRKNFQVLILALFALVISVTVVACGGSGGGSQDAGQATNNGQAPSEQSAPEAQKPALATEQAEWNGYTMGFELVSDDPDLAQVAGVEFGGKLLKICFKYVSDENNSGGFISETMLSDLDEQQFTLKDGEGNIYEYTGAMGDIAVKGGSGTEAFSLEELQPRFSITFDVPLNAKVEDFILVTPDGQEIPLETFISDEYRADVSKSS